VEPVAENPHGGFCEGGRAQEANSFKARPYPPLATWRGLDCWRLGNRGFELPINTTGAYFRTVSESRILNALS